MSSSSPSSPPPPLPPEPSSGFIPPNLPPQRTYYPRTIRGWVITCTISIIALLAIAWLLARRTPSWYVPLDATADRVLDDADVAQRKLALELHNAVQRVPLGEQKWSITQDEVNSLLAIRFAPPPPAPPAMIPGGANPAPADAPPAPASLPVSGPFIVFSPGKITVAVRTPRAPNSNPAGGVISVVFVVQTSKGADGSPIGLIKVDGAYVGSLPVPKSLVEKRMRSAVPTLAAVAQQTLTYQLGLKDTASLMPEIETAIRAVSEGEPFPLNFVSDHRQVLVKEIRVDDGLLSIVFGPPPVKSPTAADLLPQGR